MSQNIPIECSGYHAAWLNAVDFMHHGPKHPDWMQWIPCSVMECRGFNAFWCNGSRLYSAVDAVRPIASRLNAVDYMQHGQKHPDWRQCIPCSFIDAVDSMHCDWMQCNTCRLVNCIPIECSVFHAAWLNAVYSMQHEEMEPYWMQWILCSMAQSILIKCSGF